MGESGLGVSGVCYVSRPGVLHKDHLLSSFKFWAAPGTRVQVHRDMVSPSIQRTDA